MNFTKEIWENGMTLRACEMGGAHSITLMLMLRGGAAWEPARQKGITHLVEHLCFRRCAGMRQEEFYYKVERTGGLLRGITYRDRVLFEITVSPSHFNEAADILRSLFEENGWTYEDIRREKAVVLKQMEDGNDYCLETMISDFFNHSPCGEPIAGTRKKLEKLTRPQIKAQKAELFRSEDCEIILTGPISPAQIRHAREVFSPVTRAAAKECADITPAYFLKRQSKHDQLFTDEADIVKVGLTFDVDTSKVLPIEAELLRQLLCNGLLTPFTMRLREELGLLHEIQSNTEFFDFGGLMYFIFSVHKDDTPLLMEEITKILAQQKQCIDKRAFECVYAAYTDGAGILFDDPRSFAYELAFDDGIKTPQSYVERNGSITYEQIGKAAKEIFKPQNLIVSLNDVPHEENFKRMIYEKKGQLKQALEK
ncbi:MAG: pitrilysin family protein [Pygmaiobacter sp.]|nr:pitrilysin family protein [Pygmaiobacter sp.]